MLEDDTFPASQQEVALLSFPFLSLSWLRSPFMFSLRI